MSEIKKESTYHKTEEYRAACREVWARRVLTEQEREHRREIGKANKGRKWPEYRYDTARQEGKGKVWEGFISPDGVRHTEIRNLAEFCRVHELNQSQMWNLGMGRKSAYKGWRRIA